MRQDDESGIQFWFDFASTYSYISAMRIGEIGTTVSIEWKPFLLGPVFAAQGLRTSPFKVYPSKGEYMWRDVARRCAKHGIPFLAPSANDARQSPQNSVLASQYALRARGTDQFENFCRAIFRASFVEGEDISSACRLDRISVQLGLDDLTKDVAALKLERDALRANTETAMALGVFGAPTFAVGSEEELFWGDDRLEDAIEWAVAQAELSSQCETLSP